MRFPCAHAFFTRFIQDISENTGLLDNWEKLADYFQILGIEFAQETYLPEYMQDFKTKYIQKDKITYKPKKIPMEYYDVYRDSKARQVIDASLICGLDKERLLTILNNRLNYKLTDKDLTALIEWFFDYEDMRYNEIAWWFKNTKSKNELILLSRAWVHDTSYLLYSLGENVQLSPQDVFNTVFQDTFFIYKQHITTGKYTEARKWLESLLKIIDRYNEVFEENAKINGGDWEERLRFISAQNTLPTIKNLLETENKQKKTS